MEDKGIHPEAVFVQLITSCNAHCTTCPHPFTYGKAGVHPKGRMSDHTWNKLLHDLGDMDYRGQVGLYLHHEPLLDRHLFNKIRDVNCSTHAYVVLSTNGALLDASRRAKLIEAGPRQVHVNIDSADKEQYERMMGLDYDAVMRNTHCLIEEAQGRFRVEINVPVTPGLDTARLVEAFAGTPVNTEYWANSRGGLLVDVSAANNGSRFHLGGCCMQPTTNFNVLFDGSVIACCMDWMHESKGDFPSIHDSSVAEIFNGINMLRLQDSFRSGNYSRYRMCTSCASEMGFGPALPKPAASPRDRLRGLARDLRRRLPV